MDRNERPIIRVNGEGTSMAAPDSASVILGVELSGPGIDAVQREARTTMQAVIEAIKAAGIEARRIRTVRYSVNTRRETSTQKRRGNSLRIIGYEVTHLVEVRTSDVDLAGAVIDRAIAAGANEVGDVNFLTEDLSAARNAAREQAMTDAKARADQLAALGGVRIGLPISIEETMAGLIPRSIGYPGVVRDVAMAVPAAGPSPIDPGETEVRVTVNVVYPIVGER